MVIDLLDGAGGARDTLALVGDDASWTYADLDLAVHERAESLRSEGVVGGHTVPLTMDATPDAVVLLLALWRLGATPAPLNSKLTKTERDAAHSALAGEPSNAQVVLWTSGTAGRPRGVAVSYRNLAANAHASRLRLDLGPDDVWLASLSPAHVGGLVLIARALLLGSCLVATGVFEAGQALALIDGAATAIGGGDRSSRPVTHVSLVPTQLLRMLDLREDVPPPSSFRCALVGGSKAPSSLVARALEAGWPLALTYGLTEATSQVTTAPPALTARKPGTVGEALEGVEVRVDDSGEILVRGATLASGYVGVEGAAVVAADGWLHTGDIGAMDEEGHLWITGRRSDRIVSGGVTVDAAEVEEALRADPSVADACVVGLPDEEWGERVAAWVVPAGDTLDTSALLGSLRARLAPAKLPRVVHVSSEAPPRNPNGKVDRAAVRAALAPTV